MRKTIVQLNFHGKRQGGGREAYLDERGQIYLPPKDSKKVNAWLRRFGVS